MEEESSGDDAVSDLNKMLNAIEDAILQFKKQINGVAVKKADDNSLNFDLKSQEGSSSFDTRIENIQSSINELKSGLLKKTDPTTTAEALKLLEEFKNS